jgi:AraC-like DNA-binding protein
MLATPDHFGPRLFRTGGIPEGQRFAAWRDVVNGWLLNVETQQVSDAPFRGSACLRALPDLRYGRGVLGGTLNRRTRSLVAQDNDDLFLFVNSGGTFAASQRGRETEIGAGGAYLMSCAEAGAYHWPEGMKLSVIRTKHDAVADLVRNVYDNVGRAIAPDNDGLRLLIRYMHVLHDVEPLESTEARALVTRHVQDLLALAVGAAGEARQLAGARSVRAARLKVIEAHIERRLAAPGLSPESVAQHYRVSTRTLQRLFEAEGTSFTEFVLGRRLARAYAALGDLRTGPRRIGDVALDCGFGNVSHFNRQFRMRYGVTPSDVKHRDVST